jgi:hypothetical protein
MVRFDLVIILLALLQMWAIKSVSSDHPRRLGSIGSIGSVGSSDDSDGDALQHHPYFRALWLVLTPLAFLLCVTNKYPRSPCLLSSGEKSGPARSKVHKAYCWLHCTNSQSEFTSLSLSLSLSHPQFTSLSLSLSLSHPHSQSEFTSLSLSLSLSHTVPTLKVNSPRCLCLCLTLNSPRCRCLCLCLTLPDRQNTRRNDDTRASERSGGGGTVSCSQIFTSLSLSLSHLAVAVSVSVSPRCRCRCLCLTLNPSK